MHWIGQLADGMLNHQRATNFEKRLTEIDEALRTERYEPSLNALLEERHHLEWRLLALRAGLVPNG